MSTFNKVKEWNEKANITLNPIGTTLWYKSLENQYNRIQEELTELYEAINTKNISSIVDAGAGMDRDWETATT